MWLSKALKMSCGRNRETKTVRGIGGVRRRGGSGTRRQTKTVTYKDKVKTVSSRTFVLETQEGFLPGNYSYPINFPVPQNVAGTYAFSSSSWGLSSKCSSSYMVYVEITSNDGSNTVLGRCGCPIVIMQRPRLQLQANVETSLTVPIKTWCCIDRGTFDGRFVFEKNIVCINDNVWMKFYLDNTKSNLSVDKVTCYLKRKLELKTRKGKMKVLTKTMIKQVVPGCKKGEKSEERTVQFDLNLASDDGTPSKLKGELGEFAGKIQQS
mmetsp:Transcript_17308/g.16977  ORF Transcript_17308/g.16977 Transcript_17308/m.16977 type:complete len:266 (-) Transcript_17308:484-1281(-)